MGFNSAFKGLSEYYYRKIIYLINIYQVYWNIFCSLYFNEI